MLANPWFYESRRRRMGLGVALVCCWLVSRGDLRAEKLQPRVEVQEDLYQYTPADNGAGPLWCSGSTSIVRNGDQVFASGLETLAGRKPLNNCRWQFYQRAEAGWKLLRTDEVGRTREPSPLGVFPEQSQVLLSANPTLTAVDTYNGPARPEILVFQTKDLAAAPQTVLPGWNGTPEFSEHSYRSFAVDGPKSELLLCQNIGYTHSEWAFRDAQGKWTSGQLKWPWGAEYDQPEPIRTCYPDVMLKNRAVYFCGVSDVQEPYKAWRDHKKEITGQNWDYDFRRLFFTWTEDITTGKFHDWVEISSRDKTAGWIMPGDLWVGGDGLVHVIWSERAIDERLRQKFFPDAKQSHSIEYAVLKDGAIISRTAIAKVEEGTPGELPSAPRFHVTDDGRLLVIFYVSGTNRDGKAVSENRMVEFNADGSVSPSVVVPLDPPFTSYFTATVRAGTSPSHTLDLLGTRSGKSNTISYARIRIE